MLPLWVLKYVGLPFESKGRSATGLDCWGLAKLIYHQELGIELDDHDSDYDHVTEVKRIEAAGVWERLNWVQIETPEPLDVVVFNIFGRPVHVGIVIAPGRFVHSPEDDLTRIEWFTDRAWARRVEGFYRHVAVPRPS